MNREFLEKIKLSLVEKFNNVYTSYKPSGTNLTLIQIENNFLYSNSPELIQPSSEESETKFIPELFLVWDFFDENRDNKRDQFSILDYYLPPSYFNAFYIEVENNTNFLKYAKRLQSLYKDPYKSVIEKIIFDSNKVMSLNDNLFTTFIISRNKNCLIKKYKYEYYINLNHIKNVIKDFNIPKIRDIDNENYNDKDLEFVKSNLLNLYNQFYEKFSSNQFNSLLNKIKAGCSKLMEKALEKMQKNKEGEIGGIYFDNIPAAFCTYLTFVEIITPKTWKEYVYYPCMSVIWPINKPRWIGGILIPYKKTTNINERNAYSNAMNSLVLNFYLGYINSILNNSFLRSAVASIMSRNMSHIHGSHIEPGIQHKMNTFKEIVKNRMKV